MKKLCVFLAFFSIACLFTASAASAAPAWYQGKITRIWSAQGRVMLTLDTNVLSNCQYHYAYFTAPAMSEKDIQAAYVMALSAFHTGQEIGLVIDKSKYGAKCFATSIDMRY